MARESPENPIGREALPVPWASAREQEQAAVPPGLGPLPEYQVVASRVDVRASCRLSFLRNDVGLPLEQPSVFR